MLEMLVWFLESNSILWVTAIESVAGLPLMELPSFLLMLLSMKEGMWIFLGCRKLSKYSCLSSDNG